MDLLTFFITMSVIKIIIIIDLYIYIYIDQTW